MSGCPTDETLGQLGADSLGETWFTALEEHIQGCSNCQASLERLVRAGPQNEFTSETHVPERDQTPEIPGFIIGHELGRGGMGVVYQAWQIDLNRQVAVKFLRSGPAGGARERQRWLREAQSVSRVRHRNVAQIFQVGEKGGWLYLVLELIPGGSLASRSTEPVPFRVVAELVEAVSRAVEHIHRSGLLHLDIKPSNILLDGPADGRLEQMTPMIADFGIARSGDDPNWTLTGLTGIQGTPSYMAPEQIHGDRGAIGPAADIFAIGSTFYHLLTGRPPFLSASTLDTLEQVRTQEPVSPRTLNPSVPRDLGTICLRCLQKDPRQRYASAGALAEDLRNWLSGRPISARPVSPFERAWRWCRRHPVVAALATTLVLTLSVGFVAIALLWRHAEAERRRAEADFDVAVVALGEFTEVSGGDSPLRATPALRESLIVRLQRTRKLCLELAARRPDHPMNARRLAFTNLLLAEIHFDIGRFDEVRPLLVEALANWERVLSDSPRDIDALSRKLDSINMLATLAAREGKTEESAALLFEVVKLGETVLRVRPDNWVVSRLATCRWTLASLLDRLGEHERAWSLIAANERMLDNFPLKVTDPKLAIRRVLDRENLRRFSAPYTSASSATIGSNDADAFSRLLSSDADSMSAEVWAELFAQMLRSMIASEGISSSLESEAESLLVDSLARRAAERRGSGHLDEARRTADRMRAFASILVSRHPDEATAHLALGRAFEQLAKNAWSTPDHAAIEQNWKLAIGEARRALLLDPQDAYIRNYVTVLQRRLDDFLAPRR